MKIFKKETIEHTKQIGMVCDLCNKKSSNSNGWNTEPTEIAVSRMELTTGNTDHYYYNTTVLTFDVCPDCFRTKLIPWMKEQGAIPVEERR